MPTGTKNNKSTLLSVRIPNKLNDALKAKSEEKDISKAKIVTEALYKELGIQPDGTKRVGRPRTGNTTKAIRVPIDLPDRDELVDIVDKLKIAKSRSDEASPTSPRWQQLRKLLSEIDEILDTPDGVK